MPSKTTNEATRREWRELGFYYDREDGAKRWRIVGSKSGILAFCDLLQKYADDPRNAKISEHAHFGPYMYLEIMTAHQAKIDEHAIQGSQADIARLSRLIRGIIATAQPGVSLKLKDEYSSVSSHELVLEIKHDGFDPATADSAIKG